MLRGKPRYNIGEVSKISQLSIKALRYYDQKGILIPSERDPHTHYRYYAEDQIIKALTIMELRNRGFSIGDVEKMLNAHSLDAVTEYYDKHTQSIQSEIDRLRNELILSENSRNLIIDAMRHMKSPVGEDLSIDEKIDVTVSEIEEKSCLRTRYRSRICVQEVFWDRFADIYRILKKKKCTANGPITAVFHEHYTHQFFFEDGDLEILQPVKEEPDGDDIITFGGFTVASVIYVGFYAEMLMQYIALLKWIDGNGYSVVGDPIEEYLVEFSHGVSSSEYVTRISFPIVKSQENLRGTDLRAVPARS